MIEFDWRYDHARASSGLQINNVGRTHLLLKHSHLDPRVRSHVMLLVNHDLNKDDEIYGHLQSVVKTDSAAGL